MVCNISLIMGVTNKFETLLHERVINKINDGTIQIKLKSLFLPSLYTFFLDSFIYFSFLENYI